MAERSLDGEGSDVTVALQGPVATASYSRITVDVEKCVGCRICELACSLKNYGECNPSRARIFIVRDEDGGAVATIPVLCQQCEDALCVAMCPAAALGRNAATHAVVVDPDKCLGCRTCVEVCPFGGPSVDPRTGKSEKCTLCDGDPACVKVCPESALAFVSAEEEGLHRKRAGAAKYLDHLRSVASGPGPHSSPQGAA
ncbi:MAG: 4Fe-4S dicluster domain-containing protein [Thermoleophilia bacterium]